MPVICAETTAALLERMTGELAACRDPWARHWLVLPGSGRSEWLLRNWASRSGIAAHSQTVPLRSLIEMAAATGSEPFSRERLVLSVAQALPDHAAKMPLPAQTDCTVVDARMLAWSQQLADAIDLGLLCRDGTDPWGESSFLGSLAKHPAVAAALAGHLGLMQPGAFRASAQRWIAQWGSRGGAPWLWLQLDAGLPQVLLRCLGELIGLMPDRVHLSLLSPSLGFWGDLRTRRRWSDGEPAGPVLTALGRQAQDLHNQAIDRFLAQGDGGEELPSAAPRDSLLGRLQESARTASAPEGKAPLADRDASFTVHSCRSPLRELEVCRDRILQAMSEDATLTADGILLLLADPAAQAPLVGAAMQPLPVRVLGLGGGAVSPVATGFLRLLNTLKGRLGLADLQALIEEPLIAERFGFTGKTPELVRWLEEARFRWGVDARQRAAVQGDGEIRWNLSFALRRLGLGAVVDGRLRDSVVDGDAVPLDRAGGLSTALLAQLADFATALQEARQAWMRIGDGKEDGTHEVTFAARTMGEWCAILSRWCLRFLGDGDAKTGEQRTQMLNTIIPSLATMAPAQLLVRSDAVLKLLERPLAAVTAGGGTGSGGVTAADLLHYAGTPARMVLVAGLGTEAFPRRDDRPAWHPLAGTRQLGDPDRRDADRHALLLALLACGERLVMTYQGGSDEDGKERPPSTPLADLLAAVDAVAVRPDGGAASAHILIRHGLNGFSPQACAAGLRPSARSFLASDYAGARTLITPHHQDYPGLWSRALPPLPTQRTLTFKDLTDLVQEPCRIFVRRLGLHLPEEAEETSQEDLLELDSLASWSLRDRLLQIRLAGGDERQMRLRVEKSGELPPGRYGDEIWEQTLKELPAIAGGGLEAIAGTMELTVGGQKLSVTLPTGWYRHAGRGVVVCSASSRKKKHELPITIGLLCLALARKDTQVETWFKKEKKPVVLTAPERDLAERSLGELCRLHRLAECLPLPFWPEAYEQMQDVPADQATSGSLLTAGWSTWADGGSFAGAVPPESLLPATRVCFRGLGDPFTWTPDPPMGWPMEVGDASLAWRLNLLMARWEKTATGGRP